MAKRATRAPKPADGGGNDAPQLKPAHRTNLDQHRKRSQRAWAERDLWQGMYDDAYEFAIPYRRPAARMGKAASTVERVFDATAIESAFRAAGKLHQDLFPPNFWKLALGPVAKVALPKDEADALASQLERITAVVGAFFQTGEFDLASSEMCIDLLVGTGALFPVEGDDDNPIRWVCIPFDDLAIETDAYGKVVAIFWHSTLSRRAIRDAFPRGHFDREFRDNEEAKPDEEVVINQDFYFDAAAKRWIFVASLDKCEAPIVEDEYLTQPMAVPRFHRVPGEAYGRGPIGLAMPTIKTLNKASELTLKAAAIQLLGIWGYRPGGSFNPDTARLAPGEFWPMTTTGGVLGPDVQRLDVSAGKIDVGNFVNTELRLQVQSMLGDDRLPQQGATPASATEIMERIKRISQNHVGAYFRLVNETVPIIVRRAIEICYRRKLIDHDVKIDTLLVKVDVLSPIAAAVKASAHQRFIEFLQLVMAVRGQQAADLIVKVDELLVAIGNDIMPPSLMQTDAERAALQQKMIEAVAAATAAQQQQAGAPKAIA